MAARTFADQANFNMTQVVDVYWQRNSPTRSATTFTLRRRTTAGVTNDLGIPNDPWAVVITGQPCTINATREQRNRFYVDTEGQIPTNQLEAETSYADVRPGDEVTLAADSRTYSVQSVSWEGGITYLILDRKQAQSSP